MNPKVLKITVPFVVLGLGIVLAAVIVRARPAVERQAVALPPPLVRVVTVVPRDVRLDVVSQGTVGPAIETLLVAQVAGKVETTSSRFADGAFFRRNQVLVRIDSSDYRLAVAQAEAGVAQARVALDRELAEAELARQEWRELGHGEGRPLTLREPQLAGARAALAGAEAALAQAQLQLERTEIRAPFDGRILQQLVDIGQYVAPGTPLATVYSTDRAEVRLPVSKDDLEFLDLRLNDENAAGGPAVLLEADLQGERRRWQGQIVRSGASFDPKTRMLPLFAQVADPFGLETGGEVLPMGVFVDAVIAGRTVPQAIVLPRSALRPDGHVLIVDDDDRLRLRDVDVLRVERDELVLAGGVVTGERVCVSPLDSVVDGMAVRATPADGEPRVAAPLGELS